VSVTGVVSAAVFPEEPDSERHARLSLMQSVVADDEVALTMANITRDYRKFRVWPERLNMISLLLW
jgi:hypothetical protein